MTREEAYEKWLDRGKDDEVSDLVDAIYDDFKSRTCKRCKFSGLYVMGWMPCLHPENELTIKEVLDDFGCNKFEGNPTYRF